MLLNFSCWDGDVQFNECYFQDIDCPDERDGLSNLLIGLKGKMLFLSETTFFGAVSTKLSRPKCHRNYSYNFNSEQIVGTRLVKEIVLLMSKFTYYVSNINTFSLFSNKSPNSNRFNSPRYIQAGS